MRVVEFKSDVVDAIENFKSHASDYQGVILLAYKKDGSQALETSSMSAMEKSFLCMFLNAWMVKWFKLGSD